MRTPLMAIAFVVAVAANLRAQDTLQIIRHTPGDAASPGNVITVTFDRPIFGDIDNAMPAAKVFSMSPALPGKVEWRDPITLRFIPDQPFVPGQDISVRISDALRAIDGSRMPAPYSFSFRVPGAAAPLAIFRRPGDAAAQWQDRVDLLGADRRRTTRAQCEHRLHVQRFVDGNTPAVHHGATSRASRRILLHVQPMGRARRHGRHTVFSRRRTRAKVGSSTRLRTRNQFAGHAR